jgi:hypothetical protein
VSFGYLAHSFHKFWFPNIYSSEFFKSNSIAILKSTRTSRKTEKQKTFETCYLLYGGKTLKNLKDEKTARFDRRLLRCVLYMYGRGHPSKWIIGIITFRGPMILDIKT